MARIKCLFNYGEAKECRMRYTQLKMAGVAVQSDSKRIRRTYHVTGIVEQDLGRETCECTQERGRITLCRFN
jgi:hypothetical protein